MFLQVKLCYEGTYLEADSIHSLNSQCETCVDTETYKTALSSTSRYRPRTSRRC
jgi:hypothetical protein